MRAIVKVHIIMAITAVVSRCYDENPCGKFEKVIDEILELVMGSGIEHQFFKK